MLLRLVLCVSVALMWPAFAQDEKREYKLVKTESGLVRGYKDSDSDLFIFYGIPYATAPTGPNRFKAPLPAPIWLQPLDAVDNTIVCPQADFKYPGLLENPKMQENCLIANVYTPDTERTNMPVIVYVHGGGYQIGYGSMMTMKHLTKGQDVVSVSFNYRLGTHGFLCLGTDDAPGNAGMKDQVSLLRWVKKNIANFGGNPDDVTIIGSSAGSASVDLLMLSKSARGLFHKVVPESGANVSPWAVQINPLENAKAQARELNFTNVDDVYALGEFYKTASYELLMSINFLTRTDTSFGFSPCVERDIGLERFLDDSPINILKQGKYDKLPILYGFANMEGLLRLTLGYDAFINVMNDNFSDILPLDLYFESKEQREEIAKKVKEFYFGNEAVGEDTIQGFIDIFSDIMFTHSHLKAIKLHIEAGHNQVYLYEYSFVDDEDPKQYPVNLEKRGADHCAQTMAVLGNIGTFGEDESSISDGLKKMKVTMRELWINFVKTGQPIVNGSPLPAWPPTGADGSPYMSLDSTSRLVHEPLHERRMRLWNEIYERHYRGPIPPPPAPPQRRDEL